MQNVRMILLVVLVAGLSACDRLHAPELAVTDANSRVVMADDPWVDVARLVAGDAFTCLLWQGQVECWGDNGQGQLDVPEGLSHVTDIAAGDAHACVVNDGHAVCWGSNASGQAAAPAMDDVVMVAAGSAHSCALLAAGGVRCWGADQAGQLEVPDGLPAIELIAAGKSRTCAASSREIVCWGNLSSHEPLHITGIRNPVSLSMGDMQLCVIHSRSMFCRNFETNQNMPVPQRFEPVSLSTRGSRTCMVSPSGVDCWDADGKIASGKKVSGDIRDVAVGARHFCSLHQLQVTCWGKSPKGVDVLIPPERWQAK